MRSLFVLRKILRRKEEVAAISIKDFLTEVFYKPKFILPIIFLQEKSISLSEMALIRSNGKYISS